MTQLNHHFKRYFFIFAQIILSYESGIFSDMPMAVI